MNLKRLKKIKDDSEVDKLQKELDQINTYLSLETDGRRKMVQMCKQRKKWIEERLFQLTNPEEYAEVEQIRKNRVAVLRDFMSRGGYSGMI